MLYYNFFSIAPNPLHSPSLPPFLTCTKHLSLFLLIPSSSFVSPPNYSSASSVLPLPIVQNKIDSVNLLNSIIKRWQKKT